MLLMILFGISNQTHQSKNPNQSGKHMTLEVVPYA
jgi:hypothetical protein